MIKLFVTLPYLIMVQACFRQPPKNQNGPQRCLESGTCFKGSWDKTYHTLPYENYQGIRYAKPPTRYRRFRAPEPYEYPNYGTVDVSGQADKECPQLIPFLRIPKGQEDCLFMNIYVPEAANYASLPVMVWFHGGAYLFGSGIKKEYGPQYFMDQNNVILVTVNYRLGPFGFLSLGSNTVPGNAGLRDQILALKWIRTHISSFGGNPDSVTIFGESAGAHSVGMHILSPKSRGLFHRGIMQSKSPLGPSFMANEPRVAVNYGQTFTERLNCDQKTNVLNCLQSKSVDDILGQNYMIKDNLNIWMPVADGNFTHDPILPESPDVLLKRGQFDPNIDVIIGTNKDEGLLTFAPQILLPFTWSKTRRNFATQFPMRIFSIPHPSEITPQVYEKTLKVIDFYIGSVQNINSQHLKGLVDMATDSAFLYGTYRTVQYFQKSGMKVYQYLLSYEGEYSFTQDVGVSPRGVSHGDDIFYFWKRPGKRLNFRDSQVQNLMTSAWTHFATFGRPFNEKSKVQWRPVTHTDHRFLNISGVYPTMEENVGIINRMTFWDSIVDF